MLYIVNTTVDCNPQPPLQVYGQPIKHVSNFKYLASMMVSALVSVTKPLAWVAFLKVQKDLEMTSTSISTKIKLFSTTCVTVLLYGCESWVISGNMENNVNAFVASCHRIMLNIKRLDCVSAQPLINSVRQCQLCSFPWTHL